MTERTCYQPALPREQIHAIYEGSQEKGVPMTKYLRDIVEAHFMDKEEIRVLEALGIASCRLDLPLELFERLQYISIVTGQTPRELMTEGIAEHVAYLEDREWTLSISEESNAE